LRKVAPIPPYVVYQVVADLLARLVVSVGEGGWETHDLTELVRRSAGDRHVAVLEPLLPSAAAPRPRLDSSDALPSALAIAALLSTAPLLDAAALADASRRGGRDAGEHPKLAQVRALLAKAESTEYDEEAEALSAKAQELVSRHALEALLDQQEHDAKDQAHDSLPQPRRIWLDPPYVGAKAALVHEVATANRCRSAVAEQLGFCLLVGSPADLDAVELLVTSLLVQAGAALLRHGRRVGSYGASRTRSFRHAFLMAYAARIGQRLRAATEAVAADDTASFLPVLRDHESRVSDAFDAMVPHTAVRATSISNDEGWVAGLAAADLALLDVNGKLHRPQPPDGAVLSS
jgi:hypothetical protein